MRNKSSGASKESFQIILLGTGSPQPNPDRHHPAALVRWGDSGQMLVDAGDGVVNQLLAANVALKDVRHIALTHMHWDHILGYPAFVWGSWNMGRVELTVTGPVGTADMHHQLVESYYRSQAEWAIDLGFPRAGFDNITVRDVAPGWADTVESCLVEAGTVHHPPMDAIAFRFTFGGRKLVVSGDTAYCEALVDFARDADVFVVDACAVTPPAHLPAERKRLIEKLHEFHASPQECIDMAAKANVKRVVLTHHLPGVIPEFVATHFPGEVIIGNDMDIIEI